MDEGLFPVKTVLSTEVPHLVDQDDDGTQRYAEVGDEAVIEQVLTGQEYCYSVLILCNGASGFYSPQEIEQHFSVVKTV